MFECVVQGDILQVYLFSVGEGEDHVQQVSVDPACHDDVCDQWADILLCSSVPDNL